MNQKNRPMARENNVRLSRKIGPVEPEAISQAMQGAAHRQLGRGVPRPDPGHIGTPLGIYPHHYAHGMPSLGEYRPGIVSGQPAFEEVPWLFHRLA